MVSEELELPLDLITTHTFMYCVDEQMSKILC